MATGTAGSFPLIMLAVLIWVLAITLWIYISCAFKAIAKRTGQRYANLAWLPGIGPLVITYRNSGMHWWPFVLLALTVVPLLGSIAGLIFSICFIVWSYKLFQSLGRPGWWAILIFVPVVNLVWFILVGVAAWGQNPPQQLSPSPGLSGSLPKRYASNQYFSTM